MAEFKSRDGRLYIDGHEVLKGWESYSGWYWFGTEKAYTQDSMIDGQVVENDQIWFGFVQGFEEEWGYFSQGELESLPMRIWEIPKDNLSWPGRR